MSRNQFTTAYTWTQRANFALFIWFLIKTIQGIKQRARNGALCSLWGGIWQVSWSISRRSKGCSVWLQILCIAQQVLVQGGYLELHSCMQPTTTLQRRRGWSKKHARSWVISKKGGVYAPRVGLGRLVVLRLCTADWSTASKRWLLQNNHLLFFERKQNNCFTFYIKEIARGERCPYERGSVGVNYEARPSSVKVSTMYLTISSWAFCESVRPDGMRSPSLSMWSM